MNSLQKTLTGIDGLDEVTNGGLPTGRTTLICGGAAKALPKSIREAANSRGIDIAAMKHRPLLEKLIELGFEDGANADDLIQRGLDELGAKKKSKKRACSLSPDQRYSKAYDSFVRLYPAVDDASYLTELNKLYKALKSLYRGPIKNRFQVLGQQSLEISELETA